MAFKFPLTSKNIFKKERVLGVSKERHKYDLPLNNSASNGFLRLLICLMSILGLLSLSAFFALSAMSDRWSDGLSGKVSVEIPASDSNGDVIDSKIIKAMTDDAAKILSADPNVKEVEIAPDSHLKKLLSPWLGDNVMAMDSIPIPGLISVTFNKDANPDINAIQRKIRDVAPRARIDTHESWLSDVLRFTGALQFAAILLGLIIGFTTLVAVAGGVQSKLAENKDELELLHLMGASDSYISWQIQKHTMVLSLQGGMIGVIAAIFILFCISLVAGEMGVNLIPDFKLSTMQKAMLIFLPIPIAGIAMVTARHTVLKVLNKMP